MSKAPRKVWVFDDRRVGAIHTFPGSNTTYQRQPDGSLRRLTVVQQPEDGVGQLVNKAMACKDTPAQGATNPQ